MTREAMFELCNLYYDKEKFEHAKRVAKEATHIAQLFRYKYPKGDSEFIYKLGLAHDLYEDTDITRGVWFDEAFEDNLKLLTKAKDCSYDKYVALIHDEALFSDKYLPAYIVKLADMYDHFNQKDTLTEKLKNKYVAAMPYLL